MITRNVLSIYFLIDGRSNECLGKAVVCSTYVVSQSSYVFNQFQMSMAEKHEINGASRGDRGRKKLLTSF